MTRAWQLDDTIVWASGVFLTLLGNAATYNVISGCAPTYSGANLNVTIAAGTVTHNGGSVTVAGNSVTLVANGSNPRWSWVAINSAGTAVLVSGTPAADPLIPDYGDNVPVALVYVDTSLAVANSSSHKYDMRVYAPTATDSTATALGADQTVAVTTLTDITGLVATVAASTNYLFKATIVYEAGATPNYKLGITIPAGATLHAMCEYFNTSSVGTISTITASGGSIACKGFGTTAPGVIVISGFLIVAGTAGSLQFQHALNSGTGTNTTLAKSRLEVY